MACKIIQAKEQARKAEEQAKTVTERFVTTDTKLPQMENVLRMVKEQLAARMDRQCGDASTGTSQVHPDYPEDDDHNPLS